MIDIISSAIYVLLNNQTAKNTNRGLGIYFLQYILD